MKKVFKMIGLSVGALLLVLLIGGFMFTKLSPEFGGKPTSKQQESFTQLDHYKDGTFVNLIPTSMDMSFGNILSVIRDYIQGIPNGVPDFLPPVESVDSLSLVDPADAPTQITWFGHSAVLVEIDGLRVFLDPMLGNVPAPHPWLGGSRFNEQLPISIEQLPPIDAVLISHDHYDHLDYGSVKMLKEKVKDFYVPLGVGAHLRRWGVAEDAIHELNWWDEIQHENLKIVFTPSRHFSGRGITDRNTTLWGSWIIQGKNDNLYFSGDGGYGPHFREVGERYGPFDLAMMECGQYDERWAQIHMMPEESAQAAVDVQAKRLMPIHWGAFRLALHAWTDPVERITVKAQQLQIPVTTPQIGETFIVNSPDLPSTSWWNRN
ncbi:MBL fold metallo-hydrolase [Tunicatimonas pelagia]|uniref:MBL fold metallo-hydrolase n=1 Tax=Tunicatimonas pelagia TaxID=931531 RepID=UPI002664FA4A|nr:MBL fold metallo-hydrolase [Tunicatimonas pelagia]WKN41370.1 MBL fold metallo-hydrolase [Tunicatimonas pelagia]